MNFCKHVWDIYARRWTLDGRRGMPCTKCDAILEIGTMEIKTQAESTKEQGKGGRQ